MKRIKSGDMIIVIAGKSKGHIGKVLKAKDDKVIVEGANIVKKAVKRNPQKPDQEAGIVAKEAFMHVSNVALYNPITKKADKIGFKFLENDGIRKKVRYFKSNNELVEHV